jgi:hypothetical protein
MDYKIIKGVKMTGFSIERADMGGYWNKKEVVAWLKKNNIKYNFSQAYTPYVGHWAIFVELEHEQKFSDFVFDGKE